MEHNEVNKIKFDLRLKTEAKIRANVLSSINPDDSGQCLLADWGEHTPVALHTGSYDDLRINTYTLQPEGPHSHSWIFMRHVTVLYMNLN